MTHELTEKELLRIAVEELDAYQRNPHGTELRLRINLGRANAVSVTRWMEVLAPRLFGATDGDLPTAA